ncbi:hypothetical protein [Massilia sp. Mn16-1_5]|uniref:hypothetical protein n=1 Tax=Massilia sp. Mn16-1_5 TaxID=2079199 RepID=UPI00109EE167|nr:hypothetical protein [Massilia sp. Mn16-1_5]THC42455.1 hypothetical protein C2862_15540 [Massilia sp. Mn16-1_5]
MNAPVFKRPETVSVRSRLQDGGFVTVTATRRPRGGRADVKCSAPGAPQLAARMAQVARLARHTEARYDSRDQVVIGMDRAPGAQERDWELAVVLADRAVRGLIVLPADAVANGWSEDWQRGRIEGHAVTDLPPAALRGGPGNLHHLGALHGQPDAAVSVSSARAWFPLHSGGINDSLCWVEVSVYPLAPGEAAGEDAIAAPGLDGVRQQAVRQALLGARDFDGAASARWRTTVRFGQDGLHGNSYELALVLADRLARGREFVPRGRIIASGASSAWHAGLVEAVEGLGPKCALIEREAQAGDRVLLPRAWEAQLPPGLLDALRSKGASLACVERIGII